MRHLKAASPSVVVGTTVRQAGRRGDSRSSTVSNRGTIADDAEGDRAGLSVEWLREVVDTLDTVELGGGSVANLDLNSGIRSQQSTEEDSIFSNRVRVNLGLALVWVVAVDAAGTAAAGRGETVPVLHLVPGDVEVIALEGGNVVRQEITEAFVWHAVNVHSRARRHFRLVDKRSDVAGLTPVVPGDNSVGYSLASLTLIFLANRKICYVLDKLGVNILDLCPSIGPQAISTPDPVGATAGAVEEPRRHSHHVRLGADSALPGLVSVIVHVICAIRPHVPADCLL